MDLTEGSETSAKLNLMPGKYPKENIQKSRKLPEDGTWLPKHVAACTLNKEVIQSSA
jgi:hypothetical protein